jgi:hypothetical protein
MLEAAKRESLPELRERALRTRAAAEPDDMARYRAAKRSRYFRHRTDADGAWIGTIRDTPDVGALVVAALASERPGIFEAARASGQRDPAEAYDADAFAEIMRKHLARRFGAPAHQCKGTPAEPCEEAALPFSGQASRDDAPSTASTDAAPCSPDGEAAGGVTVRWSTADAPPQNPSPRRIGSRAPLLARVDHRALVRGRCEPGELCEITGVGPVPITVMRGLLGHAFLAAVATSPEGDVLRVAHLGRASRFAREAAQRFAAPASGAGPPGQWSGRAAGSARSSALLEALGAVLKVIVRLHEPARGRPPERSSGSLRAQGSAGGEPFQAALAERGVDLATTAHHTRTFRAHERTALEFRDPCCAVLGCAATARLELDHREEWSATHTTCADAADRLCHAHHWLKTHRGYRLEPGTGKRRLLPPRSPAASRPRKIT